MHVSLHAVEAHSHRWFTKRKAEAPNMPFQRHSNAQPPPPHESRNNHSQLDHTTTAFAPQKSSKGLATRFKSLPNPLTLLGDRKKNTKPPRCRQARHGPDRVSGSSPLAAAAVESAGAGKPGRGLFCLPLCLGARLRGTDGKAGQDRAGQGSRHKAR